MVKRLDKMTTRLFGISLVFGLLMLGCVFGFALADVPPKSDQPRRSYYVEFMRNFILDNYPVPDSRKDEPDGEEINTVISIESLTYLKENFLNFYVEIGPEKLSYGLSDWPAQVRISRKLYYFFYFSFLMGPRDWIYPSYFSCDNKSEVFDMINEARRRFISDYDKSSITYDEIKDFLSKYKAKFIPEKADIVGKGVRKEIQKEIQYDDEKNYPAIVGDLLNRKSLWKYFPEGDKQITRVVFVIHPGFFSPLYLTLVWCINMKIAKYDYTFWLDPISGSIESFSYNWESEDENE